MKNRRKGARVKVERQKRGVLIGFALFINLALLLSLFFGEMGFLNAVQLKETHARVAGEVSSLQKENAGLLRQLESLQNDSKTIERLARERLGLVKEGEVVYEFFEAERP